MLCCAVCLTMLPLLLLSTLFTTCTLALNTCNHDWECQNQHGLSYCVYSECVCRSGYQFDLSTNRCVIDTRFENYYTESRIFPLGKVGRVVLSLSIVAILLLGFFIYLRMRRVQAAKTRSSTFSEPIYEQTTVVDR